MTKEYRITKQKVITNDSDKFSCIFFWSSHLFKLLCFTRLMVLTKDCSLSAIDRFPCPLQLNSLDLRKKKKQMTKLTKKLRKEKRIEKKVNEWSKSMAIVFSITIHHWNQSDIYFEKWWNCQKRIKKKHFNINGWCSTQRKNQIWKYSTNIFIIFFCYLYIFLFIIIPFAVFMLSTEKSRRKESKMYSP